MPNFRGMGRITCTNWGWGGLSNIIQRNISILFKPSWDIFFLKKTSTENLQKWNLSLSLLFLIAKVLRCFLHWIIDFKKGWLMFLGKGSVSLNSSIFWFLTVLEKNLFKCFSFSEMTLFPQPTKFMRGFFLVRW